MTQSIDLDYRPAGYFGPQPLEDYLLSRVKGALVKAHEYEGNTLEWETTRESTGPLTLGELYDFLTSAWLCHEILDMNFEGDTERMLDYFVVETACIDGHCSGLATLCPHRI